jgi:hypothetical protein
LTLRPQSFRLNRSGELTVLKRIAIVAAVIVALMVVGLVIKQDEEERIATLTAGATAEVTAVSVRTDQDSSVDTTVVDYRFVASGETVTGQSTKQGSLRDQFAKGSRVKACYDPADPAQSEVFPAGHACAGEAPTSRAGAPSGEMGEVDMDLIIPD